MNKKSLIDVLRNTSEAFWFYIQTLNLRLSKMRSVIWTSSFLCFLSFFNRKDLAITRKSVIFALVNR